MADVALAEKSTIQHYYDRFHRELEADNLSPSDWEEIEHLHELLGVFEEATRRLEGNKKTIELVIPSMAAVAETIKIEALNVSDLY